MICAAATIFAACNNSDLETKKDVIVTDTSGMFKSNATTDTGAVITNTEPAPAAEPKVITKTKTVYVDRTPKTTTNNNTTQPVNTQPQGQSVPAPTGSTTGNSGAAPMPTGTTTSNQGTAPVPTGTGTTTPTTTTTQKKGMSSSTKDAIIGGAAGAVGGAIISKKKGTGAIIGGVLGAAGGYILGRKKDKKAAQDTIK